MVSNQELSQLLACDLPPGYDAFLDWFQRVASLDASTASQATVALAELAIDEHDFDDQVCSLAREAIAAVRRPDPELCEQIKDRAESVARSEADRSDRFAERATDIRNRYGDRVETYFRKESDGEAYDEAGRRKRFAEIAKALVEARAAPTPEKRVKAALTVAQRVLFSTLLSADAHRAVVAALRASRPE